ncbi:uncharacterized protein LOC116266069 isoform X2 [Nymphaea colorata]|uniref:uncharacterized protein LOC116266069 isoform X2 n=1 Tax=Nymphaea colorata TaxID=210225 RepID=UPI00129E84DB|nr:uncharacterized protein LOC116266069 isoform X2 [Nymphaea colorata]
MYRTNLHLSVWRNLILCFQASLQTNRRNEVPCSTNDGDTIDCFQIYSQPSLQHASLKDHVVQMQPTSYPNSGTNSTNSSSGQSLQWNKGGEHCPEWSVPVSRNVNHSLEHVAPLSATQSATSGLDSVGMTGKFHHEFALLKTDYPPDYGFFGASARINVWNPLTREKEFSSASITLLAGTEYISAGWIVYKQLFGDSSTRLFTFWKGTDRQCYNYSPDCPGFVHVNHQVGLGVKIQPLSIPDGQQYGIDVMIFKDTKTHDWWFRFQGKDVGYWPSSLFTSLSSWATSVQYGGEITDEKFEGFHTTTRMGSGDFAGWGYGKAAYISNIAYVNGDNDIKTPQHYRPVITDSGCYSLDISDRGNLGLHIFFGGPGNSAEKCPH